MTRSAGMDSTPCPNRIIDDMGSAFVMGACGGAMWHSVKGMRNSPRGFRLQGALQNMKLRAPTVGGNFAVWGGLFSCFDCTFTHIRKREDSWNAIGAGAATGGVLAARAGARAAFKGAVIGGVLLAMIEGVVALVSNKMAPAEQEMPAALTVPGAGKAAKPPSEREAESVASMTSSSLQWRDSDLDLDDDGFDDDDSANAAMALLDRQRQRSLPNGVVAAGDHAGFSFPEAKQMEEQ